ncbi:hypothetical protein [Peribacillus frigoritolerans]|nr:hypothetical protein [Peribacillus frigoritolerans]
MEDFMNVVYSDVLFKGDTIFVDDRTVLIGTREIERGEERAS